MVIINADKTEDFLKAHVLPDAFRATIAAHFEPLGKRLVEKQKAHSGTFYLGVNGCQGSGKSTLSEYLACFFRDKGLQVAVLSLDDFYLDQGSRRTLAKKVSPLLATRGVPGTHDTELMAEVLASLKDEVSLPLPRFNKAQDNPFPKEDWPNVQGPLDIVIMEGWCWGVKAQTALQLRYPVNALEAEKDPNLVWRTWVNQQLTEHYEKLYDMMDFWVMLQAPSFDSVYNWRLEQEQKLAAKIASDKTNTAQANKVMSESEVLSFIQYYQRLTEACLSSLPEQCDVVFKLDSHRQILSRTGL